MLAMRNWEKFMADTKKNKLLLELKDGIVEIEMRSDLASDNSLSAFSLWYSFVLNPSDRIVS